MTEISWQATVLLAFAIGCIAALEVVALCNGIDGALLTTAIGAIVAIPAYVYGKVMGTRRNGRK